MRTASGKKLPMIAVRQSGIHGTGVYALRRVRKGTRIIEYTGERVSHAEADRRYEYKDVADNHTFLFILDARAVIDAGVGGNEARFINHSCAPNCLTVIEKRRIFIDALRNIAPGEELHYDYLIQREAHDPPDIEEIFGCHCGAKQCRGTMLEPPEVRRRRRRPTGERRKKTRRA